MGELYVIYNPTDSSGNAVTSATVTSAKVCAAPNPPFNGNEQPGSIGLVMAQIKDLKLQLNKIINYVDSK